MNFNFNKLGIIAFGSILIASLFYSVAPVRASDSESIFNRISSLYIDTITSVRGYTMASADKILRIGITPNLMGRESFVMIKKIVNLPEILPEDQLVSPLFEFDIFDKYGYNNEQPFLIDLGFSGDKSSFYNLMVWEEGMDQWMPINHAVDQENNRIRASYYSPTGKFRLAAIVNESIMSYGKASWYKYKKCDCAASPDFPKGTELKVTNLDNNKSVVVTVNDFGPERDIHPDRAIDLDRLAFKKLAPLWMGIIDVKVQLTTP